MLFLNFFSDPMVWDNLCGRAEGMAAKCGIEPRVPRKVVAQVQRVNVPADTPKQAQSCLLTTRGSYGTRDERQVADHNDRFLGNYLLPPNNSTASREVLNKIYKNYRGDLSDKVAYDNEVLR